MPSAYLNFIRVIVALQLVLFPLNLVLQYVVWNGVETIMATALWCTIGLMRVYRFGEPVTYTQAFQVVLMALCWPLAPKAKR